VTDKRVTVNYPKHFWKGAFLALFLIPGYLLDEHNTWRPDDGAAVPNYVAVLYLDRNTNAIRSLPVFAIDDQISRLEDGGGKPSFLIEQETGRYSPFADLDHFFDIEIVSDDEQIVTHHYELGFLNHAEVRYRARDKTFEIIHAKSGLAGGLGYFLAFMFAGLTVAVLRTAIAVILWIINTVRNWTRAD
jgi:hypothetical protein